MSRRRRLLGGGHALVVSGQLPYFATFTRASSGTSFDADGVLQTAATNVPRKYYLQDGSGFSGLLIEGSRTNSLRNNTMVGASAPSTLPTNWAVDSSNGLTTAVIGTGTDSGKEYIDIRISGTTSGTSYGLRYESASQIAAASGETWAASHWVSLVGGATTNLGSLNTRIVFNGGTGSASSNFLSSLTATSTRFEASATAGGSTTHVYSLITFGTAIGVAIDITLRIALPQLELGSFASSVIKTTTAAATRAADVATIALAGVSWFNSTEFSIYINFKRYAAVDTLTKSVQVDNGSDVTEAVRHFQESAANSRVGAIRVSSSSTTVFNETFSTSDANIELKTAFAVKANDFAVAFNGNTTITDTSGAMPSGLTTIRIGSGVSANRLFGVISDLRYYPTRLPNAQLQAITT